MALNGKWQLVRDEGQLEHLIGNGVPEDRAKTFIEGGKVVKISISGDEVSISRGQESAQKLKLNQVTTETSGDGKVMKTTASLSGDQLNIVSEGGIGKVNNSYSVVGSELIVISKSEKPGVPDGKRIYKRA